MRTANASAPRRLHAEDSLANEAMRFERSARRALLQRVLVCVGCVVAAGCEAMVPYNWDSAEQTGERIELALESVPAQEAQVMQVSVPREGTRSALQVDPTLIEGRIGKLVARTAATSSRPPYSWGAKTAGDFYAAPPRLLEPLRPGAQVARIEVQPGVRGFRLERRLGDERATTLEFSIEPRADAYRVTLDRITVLYSRAKVADASWVNFWTRIPLLYGFAFDIARIFSSVVYGDGAVDMQIDLAFSSNWTDARGESHFAPFSVLGWTIPDVPLGGETLELHQASGWLPLPPPSVRETATGDLSFGQGHFTLWVLVTEQDELKQEYIAERSTLGQYFEEILGLLPVPVPTTP